MLQRALAGCAGERSFRSKHRCGLLLVDVAEPGDLLVGAAGLLPRLDQRAVVEIQIQGVVSRIVPAAMRSTGFGIFETGFGIAWFLGSWLLGALYDANPAWLVAVSVSVQLLAIVFYGLCIKKQKKERSV